MTTGAYLERIRALAASPDWCGKVNFTGFLPEDEIAELLAVADTVVLPFQHGGGEWNTSILGAILQKTFVLTTSKTVHGYDEMQNVYFSRIDDVEDMRQALQNYSGQKRKFDSKFEGDDWQRIAASHIQIYSEET